MDILDRTICLLITSFSSFDGIHVCLLICLFSHSSLHSFCFSYVCSSKLYHNNSLLLIIPEQTIKSFISSAWDFSLYIWDLHYIFSYIYFNVYHWVTPLWQFEWLLWSISSMFPLANHLVLPGSHSILGISQDSPMCVHASLSKGKFCLKGLWLGHIP